MDRVFVSGERIRPAHPHVTPTAGDRMSPIDRAVRPADLGNDHADTLELVP